DEGSHLEKFLLNGLRVKGYQVEFHREVGLIERAMQLDLFLPKLGLAIEIDGPSHFMPIWGQDALNKKLKSDSYKNGLLIKNGYGILRVKNHKKNMSKIQMENFLTRLVDMLDSIEKQSKRNKLFEMEIL